MSKLKDEAHDILDAHAGVVQDAANEIYANSKWVAIYCIQVALEYLAARRRARTRRELKAVVRPEYTHSPSGVTGSVVFSKKTQEKIREKAAELFSGWMINANISLGEATKEQLLAQAIAEEQSATGHLRNAEFYRALAEPLRPGQKAGTHWTPKKVAKIRDKIWSETEDRSPTFR